MIATAIKSLVLVLAFVFWLFIPHCLSGWSFVIALVGGTAAFSAFFVLTRSWQDDVSLTGNQVRRLDQAFHVVLISLLVIQFLMTFIIIALEKSWLSVMSIGVIVHSVVSVLTVCCYVRISRTAHCSLFHGNRLIGISIATMLLSVARLIVIETIGPNFIHIRFFVISASLCLIMVAFLYGQVGEMSNNDRSTLYSAPFIMALVLCAVLNLYLDRSGEPMRYMATDEMRRWSTWCVVEDGKGFYYPCCPVEPDTWSWVIVHDGWFQMSFYEELRS